MSDVLYMAKMKDLSELAPESFRIAPLVKNG
jgi:hypothetical protein